MATSSENSLQFTVVDAFTDKVFGGNPAAVVILDDSARAKLEAVGGGDRTLQLIAREFNLSETAFVTPSRTATNDVPTFGLRWFTPTMKVVICGHATLASAYVLFTTPGLLPPNAEYIHFETLSGTLVASRVADGKIELEFPAGFTKKPTDELERKAKDVLKKAIKEEHNVTYVGIGIGASFKPYMLIDLEAPFDLQNATINAGVMLDLAPDYTLIIITTRDGQSSMFVSRMFAPYAGVPEDPVTGSAHCLLGPYWQEKLQLQPFEVMKAKQVSERVGTLDVIWDQEKNRCKLIGRAKTATKGVLYNGCGEKKCRRIYIIDDGKMHLIWFPHQVI